MTVTPDAVEAAARAWDEGVTYAMAYVEVLAKEARERVGPEVVMFHDTQPVREAIDACSSRLTSEQYIAHIRWAALGCAALDITEDPHPNPYRAATLTPKEN